MSSRDFSPAPYPFYAEGSAGEFRPQQESRTRERFWLYALLFAVTLASATVVGAAMQFDFDRNLPFDMDHSIQMFTWLWQHPASLLGGLPYSLTLLTILLAHEFGHYLAAMYHDVDASLPYFMPSPFLGTFGAFIRVRSPIYTKRILFDIGIAGPLAGFVFLLPALAVGLAFSKVIPGIAHQGALHFGAPALQQFLERLIFPAAGSGDICLHPVARAAWVGMFATAMNLLPIGQLDGGHILYSFFPKRHRAISRLFCMLMLPLGWYWFGWFVWGIVLLLVGRRHPLVYDDAPLDKGRRKLGWLALVIFLLCFAYAPLTTSGL